MNQCKDIGYVSFIALMCLVFAPHSLRGAEQSYFSTKVFPILEKANCRACHNPNGVASPTRLKFPEEPAAPERIEAFGKSLVALVERTNPDESLLLKKPTERVKHAGGQRIVPGSDEETTLKEWIRRLATLSEAEVSAAVKHTEPVVSAPERASVLRRLTHSQYNNTVQDLLQEPTRPADRFPPEDYVHGFKTQYEAQSIPPLLAEAYSEAAEKLAKNAFRGGDTRGLIPCKPSSAGDTQCRDQFVRMFGRKAFRRPLLAAEFNRYTELFEAEARQGGDFLRGAQLVLEAMLQSPAFLFRLEGSPEAKWKPYETASRLSYFLWDSMPDESLLASAERGELETAQGLEKAIRRMLADRRARRSVNEFVSQWLRFDRVLTGVKDRRLFPRFTSELALAMTEETRRLVEHLVWNRGNFMELFNADYSFVNSDLAALYGVPAPQSEFIRVAFPAESERAGILGQGTFLALTSKPGDTSPTARGLFVREQFLCQDVPQPPPGVNANLPPVSEDAPKTNRQRLGAHVSNPSCAGCHKLIDPIGFGFEKFDAIGGRREKLKLTFFPHRKARNAKPVTVEIDLETSGDIAGIRDSDFTNPKELGQLLAASPVCQECVVKQLFRYGIGRPETAADRPLIDRALQDFQKSQFQFQELMVAMLKCTQFPPGRN